MIDLLRLNWFDVVFNASYLIVLLGLSAYGLHRYQIIYLFLRHRRKNPAPRRLFDSLPRVTVQLPIYNESSVVKRLLESVSHLDYPRDRLQIQVLDDSTDETLAISAAEVGRMRAAGFDIDLVRRGNREGYKAGALAHGMDSATGEYIFILDADFVPEPDILQQTIHHFTDPGVGLVQVRWGHLNRNHSLLTRMQAMFLDGHLLLEQTARCRSGRFFNFNGTAGIWRKTAIEEAGGWQADTLTEDLDLSYRAQLKGWRFVFLPDIIIPAELPPNMPAFKTQQHRWTKGSIQTCNKILPLVWKSKVPLYVKLEATVHLTSNYTYLLLLLLCIIMLPHSVAKHPGAMYSLLVDLPIFLATTVSIALFYIVAQRHLSPQSWMRKILLLPMMLSLAIGMSVNNARAVLEAMLGHKSGFTRTPKYGSGTSVSPEAPPKKKFRLTSILPTVELGFTAYFFYCAWSAIAAQKWLSLPFILLFLVGFGYVFIKSTNFSFRPLQPARRDSDEDVEPVAA